MTIKTWTGFHRLEWQQTRERNEALDCRVYTVCPNCQTGAGMGLDPTVSGRPRISRA